MQPGDIVADRFLVDHEAGTGGMSTVYRASDRYTSRPVALKVLSGPDARLKERFLREARVLADLSHPGIVGYVAHGTTDAGELFLAMDWLDGEDLSVRLFKAGLSVPECVAVIAGAAEALGHAHARGVVHRDIKPSNLFLVAGRVEDMRVLDFGIARLGPAADMTQAGMRLGTPAYMSPEQARGVPQIDARSDVFSLGAVLFECLTGRRAFPGDDAMAVLAKILLEDPPRVGELRWDVPPALEQLVVRMLAKDPTSRPDDGEAVAAALGQLGPIAGPTRAPDLTGRNDALGGGERRLLCVVLAKDVRRDAAVAAEVEGAIAAHDGHMEPLSDGSVVVTLGGKGAATDLAAQAARCALSIRRAAPEAPMALATGRGVVAGSLPVGEVIDRAARVLRAVVDREGTLVMAEGTLPGAPPPRRAAPIRPVRIDETTAGLLDGRFEIGGDPQGLELVRERAWEGSSRTLLGQVTPCVARDAEMAMLAALFTACATERTARAVLLTAPAGAGKSRLRHELVRWVRGRDDATHVWSGRGDPMSAGAPFGILAAAIRQGIGILDGESLPVRRQKLRARVARHVAASQVDRVSAFLGELTGIPSPDERDVQLRAARHDPQLLGDQMRRALEDWLAAECEARPLLLVLEDLQWGDLPTVRFIDAALRHLRDAPFMVLALARPEVHDLFPRLWTDRELLQIQLPDLSRKGAERLVRHVLGDKLTADEVAALVERAAGNPFYLEELIRAASEGKGAELPETVLAMVQARLERLDAEARRVLRAASVFGQVFWEGGVRALLGGSERTAGVSDWLRELARREVILPRSSTRFPGEPELVFRHALVREAAYGMLTEPDRALGHRLAGEWLENAGEGEAVVLAEHLERGGDSARAVGWYQKAAEQALGADDLAAAIERAERGATALGAAAGTGVDEKLGLLRLVQAEAHRWRAEFPPAERSATEAMSRLPRGSDAWWLAAEHKAFSVGSLGKQDELLTLVDVFRVASAAGVPVTAPMLSAKARVAALLLHSGRTEASDALLADVDATSGPLEAGEPPLAARLESVRALRAFFGGHSAEYLERMRRCVDSCLAAGDLRNATLHRGSYGYAFLELGEFGRAIAELREVAAIAERMGLTNVHATAKQNLGLALGLAGKHEEARQVEGQAVAMFEAQGYRRMHAASLYYLAWIRAMAGERELPRAEEEARQAVALAERPPPVRPVVAEGLAILAAVLLRRARPLEARAAAARAMDMLVEMGGIDGGEYLIRLMHAETLHATGDREAAKAAIADARSRLLATADKIRDETLRASFVGNVPVNLRILERAGAWLTG